MISEGTATITRYLFNEKAPSSSDEFWGEHLKEKAFVPKILSRDEENIGLAEYDRPLQAHFETGSIAIGKYVSFSLRRDKIVIPAAKVKMLVNDVIQQVCEKEHKEFLSNKEKTDIKEDVIETLHKGAEPTVETVQIIIDPILKHIYIGTTSTTFIDAALMLISTAFSITPMTANFTQLAHGKLDERKFSTLLDHPGLDLIKGIEVHPEFEFSSEMKVGAGFLTYLLCHVISDAEEDARIPLIIDGNLTLGGEAMGSKKVVLNQGVLANCNELMSSLLHGKQILSMKLLGEEAAIEDEDAKKWQFAINWEYQLSGIKLPKCSAKDRKGRKFERIDHIAQLFTELDRLLSGYLETKSFKEVIVTTWINGSKIAA